MKKLTAILLATVMTISISVLLPLGSLKASAATYTVVKGDTLYKIAQNYKTSVNQIMKDNNLSGSMIMIGQKLYVNSNTYTVQKGDSLYAIAKKYGITLSALRNANNIYTDMIYVGQVLNIPTTTATQTPPATSSPSYTASEIDLLARLIRAEAVGEEYQAKVAVGAVVINRLESSAWPNTISEVIYHKTGGYYQFTPVANGTINMPADADSVSAAKEAMRGVDPTNGAMFYYDTSSTNSWMLSKPVAARIDNMVFAY